MNVETKAIHEENGTKVKKKTEWKSSSSTSKRNKNDRREKNRKRQTWNQIKVSHYGS